MRDHASPRRSRLATAAAVVAVNLLLLAVFLVGLELVFGTWIRPMRLSDLRRFSIPIDVRFEFDPTVLYEGAPRNPSLYTRDAWGLRGQGYASLEQVDLVTVGGSTTDQKFLDDTATWQAVAERALHGHARAMSIANAGVDGQSTTGHLFDFQYWFPLLQGLRPKAVLFYVGINDVLRREDRGQYDGSLDAASWRVRSATFQVLRLVRGNLQARNAGVTHGRMAPVTDADFTSAGTLDPAERNDLTQRLRDEFVGHLSQLEAATRKLGAVPMFMTQTAFAWNANRGPARGLKSVLRAHGRAMNYADVAEIHQALNAALLTHCERQHTLCFDAANDLAFDVADYYDYLHNTPKGAAKIGRYLAQRLAEAPLP